MVTPLTHSVQLCPPSTRPNTFPHLTARLSRFIRRPTKSPNHNHALPDDASHDVILSFTPYRETMVVVELKCMGSANLPDTG